MNFGFVTMVGCINLLVNLGSSQTAVELIMDLEAHQSNPCPVGPLSKMGKLENMQSHKLLNPLLLAFPMFA